ncbi:MAG: hypothetical protein BGO25_06545 [Acidobacteriales bacterium 59-55]|nr:MAG: hypothetical protein BGO25_06545 [Acidobacteriales bacterium 59-55]
MERGKGEIQGSLHCGGKSAAFGRDDVGFVAFSSGCGLGDAGKTQIPFGNDKQRKLYLRGNGSKVGAALVEMTCFRNCWGKDDSIWHWMS